MGVFPTLILKPTTIILVQDAFDDSSIDTSIWEEITDANGTTTETSVLTLSASGAAGRYGLATLNGYSSNNDILITQVTIVHQDNSQVVPRFNVTATQGVDLTDRALILNKNSAAFNIVRLVTVDGGSVELNEITSETFPLTVRTKYIPSTGAIVFEFWNGSSWASLGSSGNVDLGSTVFANCLSTASSGAGTDITYSDFFISGDDYSTEFPT